MTPLFLAIAGFALGAAPSDPDVLARADERIQQHRTREALVRVLDAAGRPIRAGNVRITQTRHAFLFGCNIFMLNRYQDAADNEAYAKHFADLWNFATLPFYWWAYEAERGKPADARTEELIRWCRSKSITRKGHPLAWNYRDVPWLPDDPDEVMKLQVERVEAVMRRFAGDIQYWDVVNEATQYDRAELKEKAARLTTAIAKVGVPAYVRSAFEAARRGGAGATLIINDYVLTPAYADQVIAKLVDDAGRPLYDVIGLQTHQHGGAMPPEKLWDVCERFGKFGRPLHFTESTIISGKLGWNLAETQPASAWESTPEGEQRQADEVVRYYTVLFSHPAVQAITWWDFADKGAWQRAPAGFLRMDMTPKPAYDALKGLIKGKWWTRAQANIDRQGQVRFRGFLGDYLVTMQSDGRRLSGRFTLEKDAAKPIEVRLR